MISREEKDDYYCVDLPESEWTKIDRWLGTNVSLTSMVLTEWNKIQKTIEKGPRKSLRLAFPTIDGMLNGLAPGEILYIGLVDEKISAAFSLNIVKNLGIDKHEKILVFNSGRGEYTYARGLISLCANVDEYDLLYGKELSDEDTERIEELIEKIKSAEVSVVNTPYISIESIYDEVLKLKGEDIPSLILVDNLRFLSTKKTFKNRSQEYRHISQKLWKLAKDTRIPIVVTGPLSKSRQTMKDYWPTSVDMPAEKMLDSFDKILMVHRDETKNGVTTLNVSSIKNPNGWYGYRKILYRPDFNELKEIGCPKG